MINTRGPHGVPAYTPKEARMAKFWLRFSCTDMDANDWITVKRLVPEECLEYAGNKIAI